jgi:glycogen debranching enzyme
MRPARASTAGIDQFAVSAESVTQDFTAVTLLEGTTFCISARSGDMEHGSTHGLFVRDTRFLSRFRVLVDDIEPQPLTAITTEAFLATFVAHVTPRRGEQGADLLVVRTRFIGDGMREEIEIRNLSPTPHAGQLRIEVGTDFAHVFDVKGGRVEPRGFHSVEVVERRMIYDFRDNGRSRRLEVSVPRGATAGPGLILLPVAIEGHGHFETSLEFHVAVDAHVMEPRHHRGRKSNAHAVATRSENWRANLPRITAEHEGLQTALTRAGDDLGALRIFDPDEPHAAVIAAGAPWYMALFGRDSLITSLMTLPVDRQIALDTMHALARHQGTRVVPERDEEPGKILHEMRFRFDGPSAQGSRSAYYGSIDATPLFVMLVGEAWKWGLSNELVGELLPTVDRALEWVEHYGDRDGDGFVEYAAATQRGFPNQGWKDSPNGINFADGTLAHSPIALCEVQGYVYAAYRVRAELARAFGDERRAARLDERADGLKAAFNDRFFLADRGYFAIGLDKDKTPIDSLSSNIGHCLWTGIVDEDKAAAVAAHLLSDEMYTGFGIRTLGKSMGAYNPVSYHNGSVWPHDNAIAIAGLIRYGFVREAQKVALGLIAAAEAFDGRLPELFCGLERDRFADPVPYPSACSPQAWASAAIYSIVRSMAGLEPHVAHRKLFVSPHLPAAFGPLTLENVPIGERRVTIDLAKDHAKVSGLEDGLQVIEGRPSN